MRRRSPSFIAALALVACRCGAPTPGDYLISNVQQNSMPEGFIQGRIFDAADGAPVVGAVVSTYVDAEITAVSGAEGLYRLGPIATGSYTVYVEAEGFLKRSFTAAIQPASTEFPVGNTVVTRDLDLSRPDATLEGLVVTNTGQLAEGAVLYVDLRPQGFELVVDQVADAAGQFKFTGMPGSALGQQVLVSVAPYDENKDGTADFAAASRNYTLFPGSSTYNTITLTALGVQLITSNVSDGDLLPTEAISLKFSGQLRTNQSTLTLFRNAGSVQVAGAVTWEVGNTVATLTPVGGRLVEGQSYYVVYQVKAVNGAQTSGQLTFVARPPTGNPPPVDVTGLRVVQPAAGAYNSTLTSAIVSWDAQPNAGGYRVYGKDSAMSSAYLLLANVSSPALATATLSLTLFDSVSGDAFISPLGHHNIVKLTIVATDRVGNESSFMTAPTVDLADVVPPTVASATQVSGSADNLAGGAAAMVVVQVTLSELMSTDVAPQIVLPNGTTSAIWAWQAANRGSITITVPAGVDGRGVMTLNGGKDTSDNVQTVPWESSLF